MTNAPEVHDFNIVEGTPTDLVGIVKPHAPGIYFGMPEAEYHADRSLSTTGLKHIAVSPLTFWVKSAFNPAWEFTATKPQERGKAFHTRLLEGAACFAERYAVEPDPDDYPDALDGADMLRARCVELGLPKTGSIAELCIRIREKDPTAQLMPVIRSECHDRAVGKIIIKPSLAREIERHARIVEAHSGTEKAFRGGYPEVSIFWVDETGVPMKARIDYLKTRAVVELKTFSNPYGQSIDAAVARAVAANKYFVDAVVRLEAVTRAKEMYRRYGMRVVRGEVPRAWMDAFAAPGEHAFVFVFLAAGDVPNVRVREMRRAESPSASENLYWSHGWSLFRQGVETYRRCLEHYGPDLPWVDPHPMRAFRDEDFPMWAFD